MVYSFEPVKPPKCNHEKVFASFSYMSNPPKTPWICKKCGMKGVDNRRYTNQEEYDYLVKKKGE